MQISRIRCHNPASKKFATVLEVDPERSVNTLCPRAVKPPSVPRCTFPSGRFPRFRAQPHHKLKTT